MIGKRKCSLRCGQVRDGRATTPSRTRVSLVAFDRFGSTCIELWSDTHAVIITSVKQIVGKDAKPIKSVLVNSAGKLV